MSAVQVSDLEKRLSHHLQAVQEGERVTVLDQDDPIATIVPYEEDHGQEEDHGLRVRHPASGAPPLADVPIPPLEIDTSFDIVDLLEMERQSQR